MPTESLVTAIAVAAIFALFALVLAWCASDSPGAPMRHGRDD